MAQHVIEGTTKYAYNDVTNRLHVVQVGGGTITDLGELNIGGGSGTFIWKGSINVNTDFPLLADVKPGWVYTIAAATVTDNAGAPYTNTGQTFTQNHDIFWNGTNWSDLEDNMHVRLHDIDSTLDHNGVSGATEDNIMTFDANGLPQDGGAKLIEQWVTPPLTNSSTGTKGQLAYDATNHRLFFCVLTNTWVYVTPVWTFDFTP